MSAAGVAWGIATACAQGWLDECKCVNNDNNNNNNDGNGQTAVLAPFKPEADWDWAGYE
jgi:hypothetical protein